MGLRPWGRGRVGLLSLPELEKYVTEKVKSGAYPSASAAVNDVLAAAKAQEELTPDDVAELRAMIVIGAEQADRGDVAPWNADTFKQRLREQLARMKAS